MELKTKRLLIVGFGRTGEAVCRFALDRGARVTVSERRPRREMGEPVDKWEAEGVRFQTGSHDPAVFTAADMIVPSPGVAPIPPLTAAQKRGIPVLSEVELAFRFLKGRIVGVTGSNGKSTVATLIHRILREDGRPAFLAGNIGTPLISLAGDSRAEHVYVTELSSFQLAYTESFQSAVAVFLNITPDHLDWHKNFEEYFRAKKKILSRMGEAQLAVLNRDDPRVWALRHAGPFRVMGFSLTRKVEAGCYLAERTIMLTEGEREKPLIDVRHVPLPGRHNLENIMAAALAVHSEGVAMAPIQNGIRSFAGLEHRLEKVLTMQGVDFYNDSKATNVDATLKSLDSFSSRIVLILGGRDKGGDFAQLREPVASRVKSLVLLGEAAPKISRALENKVPKQTAADMRDAVRKAFAAASAGEIVLLAPACTSFDMFRSFEHRGHVFKQEVRDLARERAKEEP
jgi:UDP-N-acetylmuramoylalanine--D-glutamate ligase